MGLPVRSAPVSQTAVPTPRIGRTFSESVAAFPPRPKPVGAPNVVVVLLDDVGFAQLGAFGSDIATPNIDRLGAQGLRYQRFHVTALCSPSRASLMTGRNHHAVGMGFLCDTPTGFPGYSSRLPKTAVALPRLLRDAGWSTIAVGKWHLTPRMDRTASGPFETWPLGVGFERYYGFLHGDANHWTPTLVSDNHYVDPPARPEDGYHLTEDLVDTALRFVFDQQHATPGKPFFLYLAPGVGHAPHHVPVRVGRPLPGRVRQRLGGLAGGDLRPAAGEPAWSPRRPSCRRARPGSTPGTGCPPTSAACSPASTRCSPASSATSTTTSAGCGPGSSSSACSTRPS